MSDRNNIAFEIVQHFGVIARRDDGWDRELNLVRWNGGSPKYDIREWDPHHERMGRGITLREGEMRRVVELFLESKSREAVSRGRQIQEDKYRRRQEQFGHSGSAGAFGEKSRGTRENTEKSNGDFVEAAPETQECDNYSLYEDALKNGDIPVEGGLKASEDMLRDTETSQLDVTGFSGDMDETQAVLNDEDKNLF